MNFFAYIGLKKLWTKAIPATNEADSAQDILLDVLKPKLNTIYQNSVTQGTTLKAARAVASAGNADIVNITDKGILKSICAHCYDAITVTGAAINVVIDGGTTQTWTMYDFIDSGIGEFGFLNLSIDVPFSTSLHVYVSSTAGTVCGYAAYTTD